MPTQVLTASGLCVLLLAPPLLLMRLPAPWARLPARGHGCLRCGCLLRLYSAQLGCRCRL